MLAHHGGIACRESSADKNGKKDDDCGDKRRSAVRREMPERRIHLRQGNGAPREARPRPARANSVDAGPGQCEQESLDEGTARPPPQLGPACKDYPAHEEECLHERENEQRGRRANGQRNPVDERNPEAHAEHERHCQRTRGPGLVNARHKQGEGRHR